MSSAYQKQVLSLNPVAYYRLDEISGTQATDLSGNAYHGTYVNSPTLGSAPLVVGGSSVNFNGTTQHADLGLGNISSAVHGSAQVTIEAWIITDTLDSTNRRVISIPIAAGNNAGFAIIQSTGNEMYFGARSQTGDTFNTINFTTPSVSTIYHFVGIADFTNKTLDLYINGQLFDSASSLTGWASSTYVDNNDQTENDVIGANDTTTFEQFWDGKIDEVAIYNTALTAQQIRDNYIIGKMGRLPVQDHITALNPVAYWKLNETSGTFCEDSSGNGYHLAYRNTPTLWQDSGTKYGKAVSFTSAQSEDAYLAVSNFRSSDTQGSIEAWAKADGTNNLSIFTSTDAASNNGRVQMYIKDTGAVTFYLDDGSGIYVLDTDYTGFNDARWHHVVVTNSSGTIFIYVDGKLQPSTVSFNTTASRWFDDISILDNISIGSLIRSSPVYYNGSVSSVAVYDYPLTAAQIKQNFEIGAFGREL